MRAIDAKISISSASFSLWISSIHFAVADRGPTRCRGRSEGGATNNTQPDTLTTVIPSWMSSVPLLQSDTSRVDAALDARGDTLGLDPDANPFLDSCDPTCISSDCTRGFPSGYHPALEHRRQGIDDVSLFCSGDL